jgi:hypothetical protein
MGRESPFYECNAGFALATTKKNQRAHAFIDGFI